MIYPPITHAMSEFWHQHNSPSLRNRL